MIALESHKSKLEPLKNKTESDLWYLQNPTLHGREIIENKTRYVKIILLLLILNPLCLAPGIVLFGITPDWSIYPTEVPSRRAIMYAFYVLFMLTSCVVLYAHLFVCIYLSVYGKIQMELLTQYFQDVSSQFYTNRGDVHDLLVRGIKKHEKVLRYAPNPGRQ